MSEGELANAYEMLCLGCADERQQRVIAEDRRTAYETIADLQHQLAEATEENANLREEKQYCHGCGMPIEWHGADARAICIAKRMQATEVRGE